MNKFKSWSEFYDEFGTGEGYYKQFKNVEPKVGETYIVQPNTVYETRVTIVAEFEKVVLGKIEGRYSTRKYQLYNKDGITSGWVYLDDRPSYRLQEIKIKG